MDSIFNNIINSWKNSYINHNFIENQQNDIFTINDENDIHKTYYFEKSNNLIIHINTKINHLIINKCDNVIVYINSALISGLDVFHSNNITIHNNYDFVANYSLNFGSNFTINISNPSSTMNITLCTNIIYNLKINKIYNCDAYINYVSFIGCLNLFRYEPVYFFIDNSPEIIDGFDSMYGKFSLKKI